MSAAGTGSGATPDAPRLARQAADSAREGSPRSRAESWAWIYMRLSGVALLFLVLGHLFVIRILAGMNEVNLHFVTLRWSGLGWRLYDLIMLVLAMVHGANGVRGLVYDHVPRSLRAWSLGIVYVVCLATTVLGGYVIVTFSRPL